MAVVHDKKLSFLSLYLHCLLKLTLPLATGSLQKEGGQYIQPFDGHPWALMQNLVENGKQLWCLKLFSFVPCYEDIFRACWSGRTAWSKPSALVAGDDWYRPEVRTTLAVNTHSSSWIETDYTLLTTAAPRQKNEFFSFLYRLRATGRTSHLS